MNEPMRLRDGSGAARALMAGSTLQVPLESRRRAVAFTSAAAAMGASATAAAAGTTSLLKSFVLCVALGAAGGGVMSLVASETVARLDRAETPTPAAAPALPAMRVTSATQPLPSAPVPPAPPALNAAAEPAGAAEAAGVQPPAEEAAAIARLPTRTPAPSSAVLAPAPAAEPRRASLFEEQRIIESARAAVARGDLRSALALLDDYEHGYTSKQFGPEALALRVDTLQNLGQLAAARALAADFAQRYPHHPLLARVQASVEKK